MIKVKKKGLLVTNLDKLIFMIKEVDEHGLENDLSIRKHALEVATDWMSTVGLLFYTSFVGQHFVSGVQCQRQ
jgi:hypothetical protein